MLNPNAENISIAFAPNSRGNFVRNCLTFSKNTADAGLQLSDNDTKLKTYTDSLMSCQTIISEPPWGPGHVDGLAGDSRERIKGANANADRYIHCSHLKAMSFLPKLPNTKLIIITLDTETIDRFSTNYHDDWFLLEEIQHYNDYDFISNFFETDDWYNLPYNDILNKNKFLSHCDVLSNGNHSVEHISEYYDVYHTNCILKDPR